MKARHEFAIQGGYAGVDLPYALERKYPNAHLEWGWQCETTQISTHVIRKGANAVQSPLDR